MAGSAVAAGGLNLLHDGGGRPHGETTAAVLFRNERREEPGLGQRLHELGRISALAIERAPVFSGKFCAQCPNGVADRRDRVGVGRVRHHTGSQLNTSPERSSGVNEPANAPLNCWSRLSGVQPSERCSERIGRGWLKRNTSLRRTPKIWPDTPAAASDAR